MASDGSKQSQASSLPPRKINVQKFAEARASELEALHSVVSSQLNNNFRSLRNKRRRTTAHDNQIAKKRNRKRLKLGVVDKNVTLDSKEDQKKVPRWVRRRMELRMNPETGFSSSGDGTKWLRTHVWHAKRFNMKKLWGFHLPLGLQGRGRGSRAVLKWFKEGVAIHDASYHTAVQLEGPEDSLMSLLAMLLVPQASQSEDISHSVMSGAIYGKAMLHHIGAPDSHFIAPVTYMWKPLHEQQREGAGGSHDSMVCTEPRRNECQAHSRQLWLWIHASAFEEGYDAIHLVCQKTMNETGALINCISLEGQIAQLEVIGSEAFQLLQKTLHPVNGFPKNPWQLKKCSALDTDSGSPSKKHVVLDNEEDIPSCAIIDLTVQDPRTLPKKTNSDVLKGGSTTITGNVAEDEAPKRVAFSGASNESKEFPSLSMLDFGGRNSREKNLWYASNGNNHPVEENVLCMEKHRQRMDFFFLDGPKSGTRNNSNKLQQCSRSCPILLLRNSNQNVSALGWTVLLPLSWVRIFWISFVSKGAHAIGLREKQWIAGETGLPYFPSDFPDCKAYSSFMATEAAEPDQQGELRPPAMRSFKVPIPPPWNIISVSLNKITIGDRDSQISTDENMVFEIGNSFEGMVVRTARLLTDFLKDIHNNHLPLFPQLPNHRLTLTKSMENYGKLGHCRNGFTPAIYDHQLCYLRVLLHAYKEGIFEAGAVVCAPCVSDISLLTSRSGVHENGLEIPQSSVRSYFKELSSGIWGLQLPEDPASRESHRWPIGFVTTGFVRGSKKPVADAFCEAVLLARLRKQQWKEMKVKRRRKEIFVLVRNLRSSAYRLALATIVLEQQEEDVNFM